MLNDNTNTNTNTNSNTNINTNTNTKDKVIYRNIWYIDANNLYGYAMMQKLPYKDFEFITTTTLDVILNTPDDSDHGYYIVCDIDYTNECKERTEQLAPMPKRER